MGYTNKIRHLLLNHIVSKVLNNSVCIDKKFNLAVIAVEYCLLQFSTNSKC